MPTGGKSKRPGHAALGLDALKIVTHSFMPNPKIRKPCAIAAMEKLLHSTTGEPIDTTAFIAHYSRIL